MDVIFYLLSTVASGVILNLIASELFAWGPHLSNWLMRRAVERLAPEMQERMQEEWSALLGDMPPSLWRVLMALDLLRATYRLNSVAGYRERRRQLRIDLLVKDLEEVERILRSPREKRPATTSGTSISPWRRKRSRKPR